MTTAWHFPVFIGVSLVVFAAALEVILRQRGDAPHLSRTLAVSLVIVVGGMIFAKFGATAGWPVWIYYGVPALVTWALPPALFRMRGRTLLLYVLLALLLAPIIHISFSFLLGWKEYVPFIPIPSIGELFA